LQQRYLRPHASPNATGAREYRQDDSQRHQTAKKRNFERVQRLAQRLHQHASEGEHDG